MNTLLKRTLLQSALLLPLALVPMLSLAADHSSRSHDGDRHEQGRNNDHDRDRSRHDDRRERSNSRVNVVIGSTFPRYGYNSIFNSWSYGVGYSAYGGQYYLNHGYPYSGYYRQPREVIIEHNTYIEPSSSVRVYSNRAGESSLLRDLQGRCYQRTYDRNGDEIRTELDPSECDF